MNTKKIAVGVGIAGGALLAAWLFSGSRGERAKQLIRKGIKHFKDRPSTRITDREAEILYI